MKPTRQVRQMMWLAGLLAGIPAATLAVDTNQQQLDNPIGARDIPDIANGGNVTLAANQIIDVIILGDGYLAAESATFFNDATSWYNSMLHPATGLRPYRLSSEAFRVQAIFNASTERASSARDSYYRVPISCSGCPASSCCSVSTSGFNGGGADDTTLRSRLFASIDAANTAVNLAQYSASLSVHVTGGNINTSLAGMYSNLVVVMLVRCTQEPDSNPSGRTITVTSGSRIVNVGFAENEMHEFGHAFAYLHDEYIETGGRGTSSGLSNPTTANRSVWLLSNLTYSNDRCDLIWPHLAPGGLYNPNFFSPIGNLYAGGIDERGVWHSEYQCLMNGTHDNYQCNTSEPLPGVELRDYSNLCFWCEELVAVRILEKTGQFARGTDPADINAKGRTWFTLWDGTLRDRYYNRFGLSGLIAAKNACYGFGACPAGFTCTGNCDTTGQPACLFDCDIRELGNAIYVDSATGVASSPGTRAAPLNTLLNGVAESNAACGSPNLVAIVPGSYPGAVTISNRATLIPYGCSHVVIGN